MRASGRAVDRITGLIPVIGVLLSAVVLFAIQPMVAKMLLPRFGGSPAVWGACMVFFQGALLAGYGYAHVLAKVRSVGVQMGVHVVVMAIACVLTLPLGVRDQRMAWLGFGAEPDGASGFAMAIWIVALLMCSIGPMALVLAATSPLVQHWCAKAMGEREGKGGRGPWGLYAASNIGSFAALAAYPFLIEPRWGLRMQSMGASVCVIALGILLCVAGWICWRGQRREGELKSIRDDGNGLDVRVAWRLRLRWISLAAACSSLLVGVTTYLTTDVASMPLLWMAPLGIYLGTFVLAFSKFGDRVSVRVASQRVAAGGAVLVALAMLLGAREPLGAIVLLHLIAMGALCAAGHLRLASARPHVSRLTMFYLCLSLGGVLGGAFNAFVAPLVFSTAIEYPLAMIACLVMGVGWGASGVVDSAKHGAHNGREAVSAGGSKKKEPVWRSIARQLILPVLVLVWVVVAVTWIGPAREAGGPGYAVRLLAFGLPCVVAYLAGARRGVVIGGCVAALLAGAMLAERADRDVLLTERSFFGVHRVLRETRADDRTFRVLIHGTTIHGLEEEIAGDGKTEAIEGSPRNAWKTVNGLSQRPLGYYFPTGPIGRAIDRLGNTGRLKSVGFVGLGAGSLGAYADRWERSVFYEIDPAVVEIAARGGWFEFVRASDAKTEFRVGDARVLLEREAKQGAEGDYDLLVVDAFSSDAIPVHLLTQEAVELYMRRVRGAAQGDDVKDAGDRGGIVALHISNRHMRLEPVVASIAQRLNLAMLSAPDLRVTEAERAEGKSESHWVFLAHTTQDLAALRSDAMFLSVSWDASGRANLAGGVEQLPEVWTDEYSDVLSVLEWSGSK